MLKSSSFESAVKKKKKRKLVILQNREDSPKGKKNSSCRKLKPQSPRGETSCLPNGGSTLKNTNSTNKGRSVIGTVGSCQSASFLRERKKRKEGGRGGGVDALDRRGGTLRFREGASWVPTPRGSTSKLAGGRRSFWNLSPSRYILLSTKITASFQRL